MKQIEAVSTGAIVSGWLRIRDLHLLLIFSLQPQGFFFKTMNFWMMQWKEQPPGEHAGLPKPHDTPQQDCSAHSGEMQRSLCSQRCPARCLFGGENHRVQSRALLLLSHRGAHRHKNNISIALATQQFINSSCKTFSNHHL